MTKLKEIPITIWANIIFFAYVILALIGGVTSRGMSREWEQMKDVRLKYDLFFGFGFSTLCILAIVGLLLRKEWGRQCSIAFCFTLFFSHYIGRVGVYLYWGYSIKESIIVVDPDAIVISILSVLFLVLLSRANIKDFYHSVTK
jgi:hypothetical protein